MNVIWKSADFQNATTIIPSQPILIEPKKDGF